MRAQRKTSQAQRSRRMLRTVCWCVVALTATAATRQGIDPGHGRVGLALAATLAVALLVVKDKSKARAALGRRTQKGRKK